MKYILQSKVSESKSNDVNIEELRLEPPFMNRDRAHMRRSVLNAGKLGR